MPLPAGPGKLSCALSIRVIPRSMLLALVSAQLVRVHIFRLDDVLHGHTLLARARPRAGTVVVVAVGLGGARFICDRMCGAR